MIAQNPANPLRVDFIQTPLGGAIGLTHCPGRCSIDATGNQWNRNLEQDIKDLKDHGIAAVVSLLTQEELSHHGAQGIDALLGKVRIDWYQFPIADFGTPSTEVTRHWKVAVPGLLQRLQDGQKVLIHCAAGYGRTGMMAASLLVAMGIDPEKAIADVRAARPGTIETLEQEGFVRSLRKAL